MNEQERQERDELVRKNAELVAFPGTTLDIPPPENPNPLMPQSVWEMVQQSGALASQRLHELMSNPKFSKMSPKDQLAAIQIAMTMAYGPGGAPTKHLHLHASNTPKNPGGNELNNLASFSRRSLPEFSKRRRLSDGNAGNHTITLDPSQAEAAEHTPIRRDE